MTPVSRAYSGSAQLVGRVLDRVAPASVLLALPYETGLSGAFDPTPTRLVIWHDHYGRYVADRERAQPGVTCWFGATLDESVDLAVLFVPKSRARAAVSLGQVAACVPVGGGVIAVGPNRSGVRPLEREVPERVGPVVDRDSGRHARLVMATRENTAPPPDGAVRIQVQAGPLSLWMVTLPGVFSHGELDAGTERLLRTLESDPLESPQRLLDWGCGAGVLGVAASRVHPGCAVELADVDAFALESARRTVDANPVSGISVIPTDGTSELTGPYDVVLTNPPFHAGQVTDSTATREFLARIPSFIRPGGRLRLVANRFLDYFPELRSGFASVRVLQEDARYRVIEAVRGS